MVDLSWLGGRNPPTDSVQETKGAETKEDHTFINSDILMRSRSRYGIPSSLTRSEVESLQDRAITSLLDDLRKTMTSYSMMTVGNHGTDRSDGSEDLDMRDANSSRHLEYYEVESHMYDTLTALSLLPENTLRRGLHWKTNSRGLRIALSALDIGSPRCVDATLQILSAVLPSSEPTIGMVPRAWLIEAQEALGHDFTEYLAPSQENTSDGISMEGVEKDMICMLWGFLRRLHQALSSPHPQKMESLSPPGVGEGHAYLVKAKQYCCILRRLWRSKRWSTVVTRLIMVCPSVMSLSVLSP